MANDLTIVPITPFPAKVQEGDSVNNIVYQIKNNTATEKVVSFKNLNGDNVSFTTNCANLAAGASCQINVAFNAPQLPAGVESKPYCHSFQVLGGEEPLPYLFATEITEGSQTINATVDITLDSPSSTASTFDISLVGTDTYNFTNIPFGSSTLPTPINPGQYEVTVTPSTVVGLDTNTYNAPDPFSIYLNSHNLNIPIQYKENATYAVSVDITAPNIGAGTIDIDMTSGTNSYSHNKTAGTSLFDNMLAGKYNITAPNYTGTDSKIYQATLNNPYTIDGITTIPIIYTEKPAPSANYPWSTVGRLAGKIKDAGISFIVWGGGFTTAPVQISTNPPINPYLNAALANYALNPVSVLPGAEIAGFPPYIAMGTISEQAPGATAQLKLLKMDITHHYEGNGFGDRGCKEGEPGCYISQIDDIADQVDEVKAVNGVDYKGGVSFYTIDYSDGATAILLDTTNDQNLEDHLFNLGTECYLAQQKIQAGTKMIMFLNPDSTVVFQNCSQYYCPVKWKPGLSDPSDKTPVLAAPNLRADMFAALDAMQSKGYLDSTTVTTLKANFDSEGIATPPPSSGRTQPGLPEIILSNSWLIEKIAPDLPWGYGVNGYDNNNPLMNPPNPPEGGTPWRAATGTKDIGDSPWETASITWFHKINHLGLTPEQISAGVQYEAEKFATFMKEVNLVGREDGTYKPKFIFFDRYERDVIPSYVSAGFLFNGVDWDTYIDYIAAFRALADNIPVGLWQMPGASLQVEGDTFSGILADTMVDYVFGHPTLNDDFSNIATALNLEGQAFTSDENNNVYFTKNSNVANVEDYLKLTSESS